MARIVESSHLFKSLDRDGRNAVLESGYVATFAAGDVLMQQGEQGDTMYVVLSGTIRIEADGPNGPVRLAELGRDACVGEVSLLGDSARTATVTAVTDVDAVAFKRHRIQRVLDHYPKVRSLLESLVESRARDTIEKFSS
jgi:CRP-like cAMP-binding protein